MDFTDASPEKIEAYLTAINSETPERRYQRYVDSLEFTEHDDLILSVRTMNALYICKTEG